MNIGLSATPGFAANTLEQELAAFRTAHPPRHVSRRGVEWSYYTGGQGGEVILRLTGALGVAEFSFQQIRLFERRFRVIAPDYPAVRSLAEVTDGLLAILAAEGVDVRDVGVRRPTLDDVFLSLTGHETAEPAKEAV